MVPANPSAQAAALRTVFGPIVPISSSDPPACSGGGPTGNDGLGHLLAGPDPLHHRDAFGDAPHRLGRRVGADGVVVLVPATHADTDGQPATAEHVARRELLGQQNRVVQLWDHHHGHQSHPIGPRRQRAEQRQARC